MYCDAHVEFIHHPDDEVGIDTNFTEQQINPTLINKVSPELLFLAVYVEPTADAWEKQLYIIDHYRQAISKNGWQLVKTKKDLAIPGTKVILHIEDLFGIDEDLTKIEKLKELGVRSIGLTHNHANQFAGGSLSNEPLTALGKQAIKKIRESGMILDFAHLSDQSFDDVCSQFKLPVFISHAGIRSVFSTQRNISDAALQAVKNSNGFVGIGLAGSFLGKAPVSSAHYLAQIKQAIKTTSGTNVGIGSDLGGVISYLPNDIRTISNVATLPSLPESVKGDNLVQFLLHQSTLES